jgi:hypothetical protein
MTRLILGGMLTALLAAPAAALAYPIDIQQLAEDARCRDADNKVISPRLRPVPPLKGEADAARGTVMVMLGKRQCFLDISEVGTGKEQPCSSASVGQASNTMIAGTRDVPTARGCTK